MLFQRSDWTGAVQLHRAAAQEFAEAAEAVPAETWGAPRAPGKWSPAQVVVHLILAYEALLRELAGGPAVALRTTGWQRALLYFTIRSRVIAGAFFPKGIRSPREARPEAVLDSQVDVVARFRALAAETERALDEARQARPRTKLTHPYFGALSLEEALRFCAAHIRHHRQQIPSPTAQSLSP